MEESKDPMASYRQKIAATAINQRHQRAAEKELARQAKEWQRRDAGCQRVIDDYIGDQLLKRKRENKIQAKSKLRAMALVMSSRQ